MKKPKKRLGDYLLGGYPSKSTPVTPSAKPKKRYHGKLGTSVKKELFYDPETSKHNTKGKEKNVYSVDRYYDDPSSDRSSLSTYKKKKPTQSRKR